LFWQAGVFGGTAQVMLHTSSQMLRILENDMIQRGVMDNEQGGFAVLYEREPELFRIIFPSTDFMDRSCSFVCI